MTSVAAGASDTGADAPDTFLLSRPHGTVTAHGITESLDDTDTARAQLRAGRPVVGALPFDLREPAALTVPARLDITSAPLDTPPHPAPAVTVGRQIPTPVEHTRRVSEALELLRGGTLHKVVLARALELNAATPLDHRVILDRLVAADPARNGYSVDLTAAGPEYRGVRLVGSSPEVLIRRQGTTVTCHPLAGSAPRHHDSERDAANGRALAASDKDLTEHAYVVDSLREALSPLCTSVEAPQRPVLTKTPQLWHLGTPVRATLRDPSVTALDLALAVHPTPAVCGTPTDEAMRTILAVEGSRGFYAGAVGWTDAQGDGEWMVAIRGVRIAEDGLTAVAHAGGGIVAASDPDRELAETTTKFGTVLAAFGITEHSRARA